MRAYKLIFATLLLVVLLALVFEGTILEVLADLWEELQLAPPA